MKKKLKIKVCGLTTTENRQAVEQLPVDYVGFIFYPNSKRYVGKSMDPGLFNSIKEKVAVFVDENIYEIMGLAKNLGFKYIQLHGSEKPETCRILKKQGLIIIKAFNLDETFNFSILEPYYNCTDYFLFDTKSNMPGGSGKKFNWNLLDWYSGQIPFFLSGGIVPEDAEGIRGLKHDRLFCIDVNSGFEDEPGIKNISRIKSFINQLYD